MIKGYKVFHPGWWCRDKHYTCPGKFEENVDPSVCESGMHFCTVAANCFNYYDFDSNNKVAEVIAYGDIAKEGDKYCTNKLEIVREIPWTELLEIINTGKGCTGYCNSGDQNSGSYNSGDRNTGGCNSGDYNSGSYNSGDYNTGDYNSGTCNTGRFNTGNRNTGSWNSGNCNSGHNNKGYYNTGNRNNGNWNSGDWNKTNNSNGCFNTKEPKIYLFNKPSEWTYRDWSDSDACLILNQAPENIVWVDYNKITNANPEYETTGGCLKERDIFESNRIWWRRLTDREQKIIKAIPNFDKEIFMEITGIDVDIEERIAKELFKKHGYNYEERIAEELFIKEYGYDDKI